MADIEIRSIGDISVATDISMAQQVEKNGSLTQNAVKAQVVFVVGQDGTVTAAAAAAAGPAVAAEVAARNLPSRGEPGYPIMQPGFDPNEVAVFTSTEPIPKKLMILPRDFAGFWLPKMVVGVGSARKVISRISTDEYLELTVDAFGRPTETSVDRSGRLKPWALRNIFARAAAMGLLATSGGSGSPYDIIAVNGQSNATLGADTNATDYYGQLTDPRIDVLSSTGVPVPLSFAQLWLVPEIALQYARTRLAPGRRLLVVITSAGSTGFTTSSIVPTPAGYNAVSGGTWDRTLTADPSNLALLALSRAQTALAVAPPGSQFVAEFWAQGESDGYAANKLTEAQYAAKWDDLQTWYRTTLGVPNLPIVILPFSPQWMSNGSNEAEKLNIANALFKAPRRLMRVAVANGPKQQAQPLGPDLIHYNGHAAILRAQGALAALTVALLNYATAKPIGPENLRARRAGADVIVEWDTPMSRTTGLDVAYSANAGATWTAIPHVVGRGNIARLTAAPAGALLVRVVTSNENGDTSVSPAMYEI